MQQPKPIGVPSTDHDKHSKQIEAPFQGASNVVLAELSLSSSLECWVEEEKQAKEKETDGNTGGGLDRSMAQAEFHDGNDCHDENEVKLEPESKPPHPTRDRPLKQSRRW